MDTTLFLFFALAYLILLVWGLALAARHRWWTPANLPLLVVAGLVYDNAVIAAGGFVGASPLLETANLARFWIHAFVTPVLVAWGLHTLRRAGFGWAQQVWFQRASFAAVAALVWLEWTTELQGLRLVPKTEYGVLSYTSAEAASGPPLMVLIVAAVLLVVGALLWWRSRWPWLFLATAAMTVGSAVDLPVPSGAITNAFELILLIGVMATKAHQDAADDRRFAAQGAAAVR